MKTCFLIAERKQLRHRLNLCLGDLKMENSFFSFLRTCFSIPMAKINIYFCNTIKLFSFFLSFIKIIVLLSQKVNYKTLPATRKPMAVVQKFLDKFLIGDR